VRDLRKRCPWDAAQTRETLRPYLVEEVLELDQSLTGGNVEEIKDELGDLGLHLAFQIVLGEEANAFGAEDVTRAIEQKMWRRHPHLFSPQAPSADVPHRPDTSPARGDRAHDGEVKQGAQATPGDAPITWERQKLTERGPGRRGVLDGLPPTLPALITAQRLQERAAGVGFDWPDDQGPRAKIREELGELEAELHDPRDPARIEHELGDLLFAVVNLSRKLGCDARAALEKSNARFVARFRSLEAAAEERGIDVGTAGLEKLDDLWEEAKQGSGTRGRGRGKERPGP